MLDQTERAIHLHICENLKKHVIMHSHEFDAFKLSNFYYAYSHAIFNMENGWWDVFFTNRVDAQSTILSMGIYIGKQLAKHEV